MIETKSAESPLIGMIRSVGREANKSYAFVERGWYLSKRYWAWEMVWIVYNVVNALSITFIAKVPGVALSPAEVRRVHSLPGYRNSGLDLCERGIRQCNRDRYHGALGRHDRVYLHGAGISVDSYAGHLPVCSAPRYSC